MVSQHLEPVRLLDVVVGGLVPQPRQTEDLVVVLVLRLLGIQAPQVLEVVLEVGLLVARALRLRVLKQGPIFFFILQLLYYHVCITKLCQRGEVGLDMGLILLPSFG